MVRKEHRPQSRALAIVESSQTVRFLLSSLALLSLLLLTYEGVR